MGRCIRSMGYGSGCGPLQEQQSQFRRVAGIYSRYALFCVEDHLALKAIRRSFETFKKYYLCIVYLFYLFKNFINNMHTLHSKLLLNANI